MSAKRQLATERAAARLVRALDRHYQARRYETVGVVTDLQRDGSGRVIAATATIDGSAGQTVQIDVGAPLAIGDSLLVENRGTHTAAQWSALRVLATVSPVPGVGDLPTLPTPTGLTVDTQMDKTLLPGQPLRCAALAHWETIGDQYGIVDYLLEVHSNDPDRDPIQQVVTDTLGVYTTLDGAIDSDDTLIIRESEAQPQAILPFPMKGRVKIEAELIDYESCSAGTGDGGTGTGGSGQLVDSSKEWETNEWVNFILTDSASTRFLIESNNATTLYVSGTPASGTYTIKPGFGGCTRGVGATTPAPHADGISIWKKSQCAVIGNLLPATDYNFRLRATRHYDGAVSGWTAWVSHSTVSDSTAPSAPTDFAVVPMEFGMEFSWTGPTYSDAPDLCAFELWRATDINGTGAEKIATLGVQYHYSMPASPFEVWYYNLKAVDFSDNASGYAEAYWVQGLAVSQQFNNPSVEEGASAPDGWTLYSASPITVTWATDDYYDGVKSIKFVVSSGDAGSGQKVLEHDSLIAVQQGATPGYRFTFATKSSASASNVYKWRVYQYKDRLGTACSTAYKDSAALDHSVSAWGATYANIIFDSDCAYIRPCLIFVGTTYAETMWVDDFYVRAAISWLHSVAYETLEVEPTSDLVGLTVKGHAGAGSADVAQFYDRAASQDLRWAFIADGDFLGEDGADFIIYSDGRSTKTFEVDGATGNIVTVGTVDGVDVSDHSARHDPGGADAVTTAAPTTNLSVSSQNTEGSAASLARSDHSHAITASADPGAATSLLKTDASGFLRLSGVGIGAAAASGNIVLGDSGKLAWSDAALVRSGADVLSPDSGDAIRSTSFIAGQSGWSISAAGDAEFDNVIVRGEFRAAVFTVAEIAAIAGTFGVWKSAAKLYEDCNTSAGSGITLKATNSESGSSLFVVDDILRMKSWTGLAIYDNWLTVTAVGANPGDHTVYTVTRSYGSAATFKAGTSIADYGQSGMGFITLSADDTIGTSPNITMATHAGSPWTTYTHYMRLGNLDGSYGKSGTTYGMGIGRYGESGKSSIVITDANGVEIFNNTVSVGRWFANGDVRFGDETSGKANLFYSTASGALMLRIGTTERLYLDPTPWIRVGRSTEPNLIITATGLNLRYGTTVRGYIDSTGYFWFGQAYDKERLYWSSGDGLCLYNASNQIAMQFTTGGDALISRTLKMQGAYSAIAIGTTPPTGPSSGTGIWLDRTGLYGIVSDVQQATIDATDGRIKAGAGDVVLDADGITINAPDTASGPPNTIKWKHASDSAISFDITAYRTGASPGFINAWIAAESTSAASTAGTMLDLTATNYTSQAQVTLFADYDGGSCFVYAYPRFGCYGNISAGGGLYAGSWTGNPGAGEIIATSDGRIGGGLTVGYTGANPDAGDVLAYSGSTVMAWIDASAGDIRLSGGAWIGGGNVANDPAADSLTVYTSADSTTPYLRAYQGSASGTGNAAVLVRNTSGGSGTTYVQAYNYGSGTSYLQAYAVAANAYAQIYGGGGATYYSYLELGSLEATYNAYWRFAHRLGSYENEMWFEHYNQEDAVSSYPVRMRRNAVNDAFTDFWMTGNVHIGSAYSNTRSTTQTQIGLTIYQGSLDDDAFIIRNSDVAHGYSGIDTDTYYRIRKCDEAAGGADQQGFKDAGGNCAMMMTGFMNGNAGTTHGTSGRAIVEARGCQISGGALANIVAEGNVFGVRTYKGGALTTIAIIDEDGDLHLQAEAGTGGTVHGWDFDDDDDYALLTGLRASVHPLKSEFRKRNQEFLDYARPVLEACGIVSYNDGPGGDGVPFISIRGGLYLTIDGVRQVYQRLEEQADRIGRLERALLAAGIDPLRLN